MTQDQALQLLKMGENVFLTGQAGSGKTHLLNTYIEFLKKHGVGVGITASTGIAATHIGGRTIHSWAGIGIMDELTVRDIRLIKKTKRLEKQFKETKVLIIDEVSMLHSFRLDMVDQVCRAFLEPSTPFGGLQVVLSGDFFQLPPISRYGEEPAKFVYQSKIWQEMDLKICYLEEQFRQEDSQYLTVLNAIRSNSVDEDVLDLLRKRYKKDIKGIDKPTKLYTHNMDVDGVNQKELSEIDEESQKYPMGSHGSQALVETLQKGSLVPAEMELKVGAQVMFLKNNFQKGYVNGTLGTVIDFSDNRAPIVETLQGKTISVEIEKWAIEEKEKEIAWIVQLPIRLAWAITVHKSQGMSLDAAEIDLSKAFEPGMGYVALSRVKSLDGVRLLGLNKVALKVNEEVLEYDESLHQMSHEAQVEIDQMDEGKIQELQEDFFNEIGISEENTREVAARKERAKERPNSIRPQYWDRYAQTRDMIVQKKSLDHIASHHDCKPDAIVSHIDKLKKAGIEIDVDYLMPDQKIIDEVVPVVQANGADKIKKVYTDLNGKHSYLTLKLVIQSLSDESSVS